jgi:hypothetical protein
MAECTTSKSQKGPDQDGLPLAAADSNGMGAASIRYYLFSHHMDYKGSITTTMELVMKKSSTRELVSKHKKRK